MKESPKERARLFDTHVHFDGFKGTEDIRAVVDRAAQAGVTRMIAVGGTPEANRQAVDMACAYPECVRAAVGYNRDQAEHHCPMDELMALMATSEVVAIGETGLDFHSPSPIRQALGYGGVPLGSPRTTSGFASPQWRDPVPRQGELHHESRTREAQISLFRTMLTVARERRLPVIVHSREAEADTLALLQKHAHRWTGPSDRIGVQHCFTGSRPYADRLLEMGFFISFSGIITFMARGAPFKNAANLREIAALIPAERLLIETDSPWLAPEPFRGKPNEPANVRRVAETLAEIRHTSVEAIAAATFRNAERLFG